MNEKKVLSEKIMPFPKKHGEIHPIYYQKEIEEWRVTARDIVKEILTEIKNRDKWDSELSAKINYGLLQDRFEHLEKKVEMFLLALGGEQ